VPQVGVGCGEYWLGADLMLGMSSSAHPESVVREIK